MLHLSYNQTEDFISSRIELLFHLFKVVWLAKVFEKCLDVSLNICLLKAIAVMLSLYVFVGHFFTVKTFLLPKELKFDVSGHISDWQFLKSQLYNFTLNVWISHALQLRVQIEVRDQFFVRELHQRLNLINWFRITFYYNLIHWFTQHKIKNLMCNGL